ncbi:hypothetical protein ACFHW2_18255 [Actinomadura sp. LOL_016]|uniref:hypothetical protein n=1 Tax=unclassified Actinomadura TaxID=2626254 RepID=UPI003A811ED0
MKTTTSMAVVAIAAVLPWTLAVAPAQADVRPAPTAARTSAMAADHPGPHHWMHTDDDNPGGRVDFWPQGDIIRISDTQDDGAKVEVTIRNETKDPDKREYKRSFEGAGWGIEYRASMGQPYNFAEGHCFRVRIRLIKNGEVVSGSKDNAQWRNYNNTTKECPGVE